MNKEPQKSLHGLLSTATKAREAGLRQWEEATGLRTLRAELEEARRELESLQGTTASLHQQIREHERRETEMLARLAASRRQIVELEEGARRIQQTQAAAERALTSLRSKHAANEKLLRGWLASDSLDQGCTRLTLSLYRAGRREQAAAFVRLLSESPRTEPLGRLAHLALAIALRLHDEVDCTLEICSETDIFEHFPIEFLSYLAAHHPETFRTKATQLMESRSTPPETLSHIARMAFVAADLGFVRRATERTAAAYQRADQRPSESLRWIQSFLASRTAPIGSTPPEVRRLGVLDYGSPDLQRASRNVGDWIQSLAFLGLLSRFRFAPGQLRGDADLLELIEEVSGRCRPGDHLQPGSDAPLELVTVDRDSMSTRESDAPVWLVTLGWFMHPRFGRSYDFPFPSWVRPIFISFHLNRNEALDPRSVAYLKQYAPIGCRDWHTVYVLLSHGIPAFFSGCMTLTLDQVFGGAPHTPSQRNPVVSDVQLEGATAVEHENPEAPQLTFVENLRIAREALATYRDHPYAVTSRLHGYLPCLGMGVPVEFRPRNASDIRYEGLVGLSPEDVGMLKESLRNKVAGVLESIVAGLDESVVYERWRNATQQEVKGAQERLANLPKLSPSQLASQLFEGVRRTPYGPGRKHDEARIEVLLAATSSTDLRAAAQIQAVLATTATPVRFHVLELYQTSSNEKVDWGAVAPGAEVVSLEGFNLRGHPARRTNQAKVLAAAAALLPEVDRVLWLAPNTMPTGDLAPLWSTDLDGAPVAARPRALDEEHGHKLVHNHSLRLGPSQAQEFRRRMYGQSDLAFTCLDPDVLLRDLAAERVRVTPDAALALIEKYHMEYAQVVNCLFGPAYYPLERRWCLNADFEWSEEPGVHKWSDRRSRVLAASPANAPTTPDQAP